MATAERTENSSLKERIFREFYRFTFFQAVSLLERMNRQRSRLGSSLSPSGESIRFGVKPGFAFPPSEITLLEECADGEAVRLEVAFLGLIGPAGVLPRWYNELAMERIGQKDTGLTEFFDMFHHRLLTLFYLAWKKQRFGINYRTTADDNFSFYLRSLIGLGNGFKPDMLGMPSESTMFCAGHFARQIPTAMTLCSVVSQYFQVKSTVDQFVAQLITLEPEDRTAIGSANSRLGFDAVCGSRISDTQSKFRLLLGPMSFALYSRFLPNGDRIRPLFSLVRYYVGVEYEFEVRIILDRNEALPCILGAMGATAPRLGWSTWLKSPTVPLPADPYATFQEQDVA